MEINKQKFIYVLSYVATMIGLFLWNGPMYIFFSIFGLGLPLVPMILPIVGMVMLLKSISKKGVILGFVLTLPILGVLVATILSLPLRTNIDTYSGMKQLTPIYVTLMILIGGSLFFIMSIYLLKNQLVIIEKEADKPKMKGGK